MKTSRSIITVAGVLLAAGAASAQQVLGSFGFTDLDGSYDLASSVFQANAVDTGNLRTGGDVTRLVNPGGTALFETGFASLPTAAQFNLSLNVTDVNNGARTANGNGAITITDADGDTITANVNGSFVGVQGGIVFFTGLIDRLFLNDNGQQDGTFNGPTGGSFGLDFGPAQEPFTGAVVQLFLDPNIGFFNQNYKGVSTQVSGQWIPAPGAAALLGLGGLIAARRRRA